MINLEHKVALVTGGSRGIGAAIAKKLSQAGATVAITYIADKKSAESIVRSIRESGKQALCLRVNAARGIDVKNAVKTVRRKFGRVDILVNNAGIWKYGEIGNMTERQWDETLDVNLKSAFLFSNEVVPLMKKQGGGKIINITSTAGQRGEPYHSHYAASKAGLIGFTKAIGAELARHNILVNNVSPGWVATDMSAETMADEDLKKEIEKEIPRGRIATPDDIAGSVLFLASDLSNHLVGSTISVNGGSVLSN
ncbi:MAG: 3-oxoacyl-ACP reductase family protein [Bacteroidota bacterium]